MDLDTKFDMTAGKDAKITEVSFFQSRCAHDSKRLGSKKQLSTKQLRWFCRGWKMHMCFLSFRQHHSYFSVQSVRAPLLLVFP
jgi:hypothetical protein